MEKRISQDKLQDRIFRSEALEFFRDGFSGAGTTITEANSANILSELQSIDTLTGDIDTILNSVLTADRIKVELAGASGDINITAGDIGVQLSHDDINFDSTRIGDGTNLLSVNADGSLDVNVDTSLLATQTKQDDIITALGLLATEATLSTLNGKVTTADTDNVTIVGSTLPTGASTEAKQDNVITELQSLLTELQAKADLSETQPVSVASIPSHDVTNAGTFAVQVTSMPDITATALDIRPLVNTDVITAELSAVDNAVLDSIVTNTSDVATETTLATIAGTVSGTELQVDVLTQPNLDSTTDSVSISDGTDTLEVNTDGSIDVNSTETVPSSITHSSNGTISDVTATQITSTSSSCRKVIITAGPDNTGYMRVGGSTVSSSSGIILYAGESFTIEVDDPSKIYAIAEVANEDISMTVII